MSEIKIPCSECRNEEICFAREKMLNTEIKTDCPFAVINIDCDKYQPKRTTRK